MKKLILPITLFLISAFTFTQAQIPLWYPFAQGADSVATAIDSHNGTIYISGPFTSAFGFTANNFGMYQNGHGVNPGAGFTNGYANSFLNFGNSEYAGGTFNGYFLRLNLNTKTWDSVAPVTSPVIKLDTFRGNIVIATDSSVMLYDTATQLLSALPVNFNGLLAGEAVYDNKIWMTGYTNNGDTSSNLYTWDGATIGDSTVPNFGIVYLYSDGNSLFISGSEINGSESNVVAIYTGPGGFNETSGNWNYSFSQVGFVTSISGNPSTGYLFGGAFKIIDGNNDYYPVAYYQNDITEVLGVNLAGTAYGVCFNSGDTPVVVGSFQLNDTNGYNVVILGSVPDTGAGVNQLTVDRGQLTVYPNPFHTSFTVTNMPVNTTYLFSDVLGRTIAVLKPTGNELTFEDDALTPGIYFLTEIENPGTVFKLIKQ